ncbi:MAG: hypothetical protein RBU37_03780 [Myxococcota bacterium]|nr:hypothetical protein [Myxococcota bacterium]
MDCRASEATVLPTRTKTEELGETGQAPNRQELGETGQAPNLQEATKEKQK